MLQPSRDLDGFAMAIIVRNATEQDVDTLASLNADVQALHAAALPWHFKTPGPNRFPRTAAADVLAWPENLVFSSFVSRRREIVGASRPGRGEN
jgi:hypothetical protein